MNRPDGLTEAQIGDLEWRRFVEQVEAQHAQEQSGIRIRRSAWPFHITAVCQRSLEMPNTRVGVREAIEQAERAVIFRMEQRLPDDLSVLMLDACPPEHALHPVLHRWYDTTIQGMLAQWQMFSPEAQRTVYARMKAPMHVLIVVSVAGQLYAEKKIETRLGARLTAIIAHVFHIPQHAKMEVVAVARCEHNAWRLVVSENEAQP